MPNLEISGTKGLVQVSGAGGHLKSIGTAPTLTVTTTGNGTCTVSGTDTIGELTFADTWADGDTVLVTFNKAYGAAPKVMLSSAARINASGAYFVVETSAT